MQHFYAMDVWRRELPDHMNMPPSCNRIQAIALFCFLCLAAGLNTLAEVADERPKSTQYVLKGMARFGIALNAFIGASTSIGNLVGFVGVVAHIMYLLLAPSFPALDILSTKAVGGLLLLAAHNFAAFRQFAREEYPHDEVLAYHVRLKCAHAHAIRPVLFGLPARTAVHAGFLYLYSTLTSVRLATNRSFR